MVNERVIPLAPDLTKTSPRSPAAPLGDCKALAARALDKCRAELAGTAGPYHFNCPVDTLQRLRAVLTELGRLSIPTPEKRSFEAEGILLERALTKCIQQRDETLRQLRDAVRRVDKAAFKDQADFGLAHQALLNVCDRFAEIVDF
jgi:hypothetical protein